MAKRQSKSYKERIKQYEYQYKMLVSEYNKRMKEIIEAGRKSPASNVLLSNIPSVVLGKRTPILKRPKKRSLEVYTKAIKELEKFFKAKTSNLKGVIDISNERVQTFREKYPSLSNYTNEEIEDLLDFLGSVKGENAKAKYDSDQLIVAFSMQKKLKKNEDKQWEDIYNEMLEKNATTASYIREVEESSENDFIPF